MAMARNLFTSALLLLSSSAIIAGTQDDLLQSLKKKWPDKQQGTVVCNIQASSEVINSLAAAAGKLGITLAVFNVANDRDVDSARGAVVRSRPDFVVLVDEDPVLGASGQQTKSFIQRIASAGVPTVSTGEALVKIGAVMSPAGPRKN